MANDRLQGAGQAARAAAENQYLRRLIEDQALRENLRVAYESARRAYGRLNNGKAPTRALVEDKKLQRHLRDTAQALKEANASLRTPPRRRRRGIGSLVMLALVGGVAAVALNEGIRAKLLDALFGKEEEFDYSSSTAPPTPAPQTVAG